MHTVFCSCGEAYQVTDQHVGRRIKCGRCGNAFQVTGPPRSGPDPRRSQQQAPPRDPYRDQYRQEPPRPRDPYREPPRDSYRREEAYRSGPPPRDSYDDDYRRGGEPEFYDEGRPGAQGFKMPDVGGFIPPKLRLYLFIAFAGLMLAAAGLLLSSMKPVGSSLPQPAGPEGGF